MRSSLAKSLNHHQIESLGIVGLALPVNLTASSNQYIAYPCRGILVIIEHGANLTVNVAVFHRLCEDGTLDAPVEVKRVEFIYDSSIVA